MATVTNFQMMKVTAFSDGTDTYHGIRSIGYRINPLNTVAIFGEGDLRPDRLETVETETPKVQGQVELSGPNADALIGTTITTATVTVRDVTQASGNKTIVISGMTITGVSSGANNRSVNGATYDFVATDIEVS